MKSLLIFCMLLPGICQAQDSTRFYTQKSVWRVLFLPLGVTNEARLGPKTTLVSTVALGSYFGARKDLTNTTTNTPDTYYGIYAGLSVAGRYFYNFERRLERGKSIRANSGNYLTVKATYNTPTLVRKDPVQSTEINNAEGASVQVMWGFQRTYRKNFYLNLGLGLGARRNYVGPSSDFAIGYTFPNRQFVPVR